MKIRWIIPVCVLQILFFSSSCVHSHPHQSLRSELNETFDIFSKIGQPLEFDVETKNKIQTKAILTENLFTREGRPIPYYVFNFGIDTTVPQSTVLFVGGIHPNEFAASYMSWKLLEELMQGKVTVPENIRLVYIPLTNPDGWIGGYKRNGYPTRKNSPTQTEKDGLDLNREFVDHSDGKCSDVVLEPEVTLIQNLIKSTGATQWVSLHSARNVIELDGAKTQDNIAWQNTTSEASQNPFPEALIPTGMIGTFNNTSDACKGSLGRYANLKSKTSEKDSVGIGHPGLITFELPGPGKRPDDKDPDFDAKLLARMQLGYQTPNASWVTQIENNPSLAKEYYTKYRNALITSLRLKSNVQ